MRTIITYGTFDLFHVGHLNLLERASTLGNHLIVGVSTDEFNSRKDKRAFFRYDERAKIVASLRCVNSVIPEEDWEQKRGDISRLGVDVFVMGSDWAGKFDDLRDLCEVEYLSRTEGISSSDIRSALAKIDEATLEQLNSAVGVVQQIVRGLK